MRKLIILLIGIFLLSGCTAEANLILYDSNYAELEIILTDVSPENLKFFDEVRSKYLDNYDITVDNQNSKINIKTERMKLHDLLKNEILNFYADIEYKQNNLKVNLSKEIIIDYFAIPDESFIDEGKADAIIGYQGLENFVFKIKATRNNKTFYEEELTIDELEKTITIMTKKKSVADKINEATQSYSWIILIIVIGGIGIGIYLYTKKIKKSNEI